MNRSGFSLLEILVVLVIIGITAGLINLSGADRGGRETRLAAERLAALLRLARQEAILTGVDFAVLPRHNGYGFRKREGPGAWTSLADDETFRARNLPEDAVLNLAIEGEEARPAEDAGPGPSTAGRPMIYLLSSGEITPFVITISNQRSGTVVRISGSYPDKITVTPES